MYIVLVSVSMKKDLSIFINMGSIGAICVTCMIIFIISYSSYSMTKTNYKFMVSPPEKNDYDPVKDLHYLFLFNSTWGNLGGLLCVGYYMHQFTIPILNSAKYPEKNIRNVFFGYLLVFLCYVIVGTLGYIGFSGEEFDKHMKVDKYHIKNGIIDIS